MMLKIEHILESGKTRLHPSGELRSFDIEEVRAEIEKISPRVVLDLAKIGVVDIGGVALVGRMPDHRHPGGKLRALHPRMDASGKIMNENSRRA
jgi:ABC-type transporter Mla MlaB component